ncbi:hypothetical protein [Burkholderia contaminans]|uniref:hypothetical protein n=1 Tax=Burkholderia contaminans TaxID=488447 RepID=UPI0015E32244|nr:hypothetical protein [Burkholderia contaminans]
MTISIGHISKRSILPLQTGNRVTTTYNVDDSINTIQKATGTAQQQNYVQYTYTPNGKLNSSADAKNNLTVYAYNGFDRLTNRYYPLATHQARRTAMITTAIPTIRTGTWLPSADVGARSPRPGIT